MCSGKTIILNEHLGISQKGKTILICAIGVFDCH